MHQLHLFKEWQRTAGLGTWGMQFGMFFNSLHLSYRPLSVSFWYRAPLKWFFFPYNPLEQHETTKCLSAPLSVQEWVTKVRIQETILFCLIYFMMYIRNKHRHKYVPYITRFACCCLDMNMSRNPPLPPFEKRSNQPHKERGNGFLNGSLKETEPQDTVLSKEP